jgi:hypothetical protein
MKGESWSKEGVTAVAIYSKREVPDTATIMMNTTKLIHHNQINNPAKNKNSEMCSINASIPVLVDAEAMLVGAEM